MKNELATFIYLYNWLLPYFTNGDAFPFWIMNESGRKDLLGLLDRVHSVERRSRSPRLGRDTYLTSKLTTRLSNLTICLKLMSSNPKLAKDRANQSIYAQKFII